MFGVPSKPNSSHWKLVTKEIPDKKIADFERDFVVPEILGCNSGELLRLVQVNNKKTYLLLISAIENKEDGANINIKAVIYELFLSGELMGSDYIFSYIDTFTSEKSGCGVDKIYEEEISSIIELLKSKNNLVSSQNSELTYNELMSNKQEESDVPGYFKTGQEGKTIEWKAKISSYYSQITGIKFCVLDHDHQNIDISKPCDIFWACSNELMSADDLSINPSWDGHWVKYILKYYNVQFDENTDYYNDVYTVKGIINGVDCAPADKCSPDIEIISIKK